MLVLRRRPDDDDWWELVDPAAPSDQPAAGVAHTRTDAGGVTHIVAISALDRDLLAHLVRQLVAALRSIGTAAITIRGDRPDIAAVLHAEEFVPVDHDTHILRL